MDSTTSPRSEELSSLLTLATSQLLPFIASADANGPLISEEISPSDLSNVFNLSLPTGEGQGSEGLEDVLRKILRYSVNTWNQGFMDKLYASTDPVGVVSDLILGVLNTNVHVYQVAPALTVIERDTAHALAGLFGFNGPFAGGMTLPGGSSSNTTSMIIAKNTLYPETKTSGNGNHRFVVFTSSHGHYSIEKAAILCGFGSSAVKLVPVDVNGRMIVAELERMVQEAKDEGYTPFYVNAGAGTTVLGSYDPFEEISVVCKREKLWFHVDGSWGGSVVFSESQRWRCKGVEKADSVTVNPHKMLGVPMTCSFLLCRDRRVFQQATSLKAAYLFHGEGDDDDVFDLAQMTMGCGRRGDALKMAVSWIYHGRTGYQRRIDHAFSMAAYFANLLDENKDFVLVSERPPPCLQVCFFYSGAHPLDSNSEVNSRRTREIAKRLVGKGFMIDYSPDPSRGEFFRAVVNGRTTTETVERLISTVQELGRSTVPQ